MTKEPAWIAVGRTLIGTQEIRGPKHNGWIVNMWKRLGAWFRDDETAWCGGFVGHCMDAVGLPIPKAFYRAAAWKGYGRTLTAARVGCIGVKSRAGGNHVFFIIGETRGGKYYKVLHGNAGDMVCIGDIAKASVDALQWPNGVYLPPLGTPLPEYPAGTISTREG